MDYWHKITYKLPIQFIALLLLISCNQKNGEVSTKENDKLKVQSVEVVQPIERSFTATLLITGTAMPNQQIMLHSMESGYVKSITKDIGDKVNKGEVVATLDNPELSRTKEKLAAQQGAKKAIYDRLKLTSATTPDLTPMQVLDEAKADFVAASASLKAIEDRLGFLKVAAPFNGVITKRLVDHGALVQSGLSNSNATPIAQLQQLNPIRLTIPLPESDVASIKVGMDASITFPELPGKPYNATVSRIAKVLDIASKTMQVEIDIENPEGTIKPGMHAKVYMQLSSRDNVLSLPITAQYMYKDELFVLAVNDNKVVQIPLRKGLENKDFFEVLNEEIGPKTQVIVQGKGLVKPGHNVTPVLKSN